MKESYFLVLSLTADFTLACFGPISSSGPAPNQNIPPEQYNNLSSPRPPPAQDPLITGGDSKAPFGCGHSRYWNMPDFQTRIVGGVEALPNEFPWQVRLEIDGKYLCGGSIINNQWILTAAHCTTTVANATKYIAVMGDHNSEINETSEVRKTMQRIVRHPQFSATTMNYDFALLRMSTPVDFNNWEIQPVCLPKTCNEECLADDIGFISGWGKVSSGGIDFFGQILDIIFGLGGTVATKLQKAKVPLVSPTACNKTYGRTPQSITSVKTCAGYPEGLVDTCQGDSGGPLTCPKYGFFMLMGVTSYGQGCGEAGYYGVYARVCTVVQWIAQTVGSTPFYLETKTDGKSATFGTLSRG